MQSNIDREKLAIAIILALIVLSILTGCSTANEVVSTGQVKGTPIQIGPFPIIRQSF